MRIITYLFLILALVLSFGIWRISLNAHLVNSQLETAEKEAARIGQEAKGLAKYKDEKPISLEELYPEVYSNIKEACSYYQANSEIRLAALKDLEDIKESFKESQYRGIKYADVFVKVDLKNQKDAYLISVFCRMIKTKPAEILELGLEKDKLNLTLRLYGT